MEAITRESFAPSFTVASIGSESANIYHFVFRSSILRQVISPPMEGRYASPDEQKRLLRVYQKVRQNAHNMSHYEDTDPSTAGTAADGGLQVLYQTSAMETVVALITRKFELFVTLSATESKSIAMKSCLAVLQWISSREPELFIQTFPTWS